MRSQLDDNHAGLKEPENWCGREGVTLQVEKIKNIFIRKLD